MQAQLLAPTHLRIVVSLFVRNERHFARILQHLHLESVLSLALDFALEKSLLTQIGRLDSQACPLSKRAALAWGRHQSEFVRKLSNYV